MSAPPPFASPTTALPLHVVAGNLVSEAGEHFDVVNGIPRFVSDPGYAKSFGPQWERYRLVQLDSASRNDHSHERLAAGTGWSAVDLAGKTVLEVGCGAGRFTEVLLEAGARLTAVDATRAIDACRETIGERHDVRLAQADVYALPFPPAGFDFVFCYGVIQHTPDPRATLAALVRQLKPGGRLALDSYRKAAYIDRWSAKRLWRPLTIRIPNDLLRRIVEWYVPRWLPLDTRLARVPRVGRFLVAVVPCWNYTGLLDLTASELEAWAVLDTFDALAPRYDKPQSVETLERWCRDEGLEAIDVRYGGNGVLVNARKPLEPAI